MKKVLTPLLLLVFCALKAQKEDYIWPISHTCGLWEATQINFNNSPPTAESVEKNYCFTGQFAAICDMNGDLLMYSNGLWIINSFEEMMDNSDSLNAGDWANMAGIYGYPVPQSSFFLQQPGHDEFYYLFHMFVDWIPAAVAITKFYYTVIDINNNNGHGKVLEKNIPLLSGDQYLNFNQPTAVRHANGRDWWILVPNHMGPQYYRFLFTPNGVEGPWEQEIGFRQETTNWFANGFGQRVFSTDGSKFADYDFDHFTQVFDFDRCTGLLGNARLIAHGIDPSINNGAAGVAFSPSGRFLYISRTDNGYSLFQYDTEASDILSSETEIYHCALAGQQWECGLANLRLAPDGKIYISGADTLSYSVIHHPDSLGLACDFELGGLTFPLAYPEDYFPYWPNYRLGALEGSSCDTITATTNPVVGVRASMRLAPNPATSACTVACQLPVGVAGVLLVTDILGVRRGTYPLVESDGTVLIDNLPAGTYFVTLQVDGAVVQTQKLIIN